jgi:hypothetical protein
MSGVCFGVHLLHEHTHSDAAYMATHVQVGARPFEGGVGAALA